jgi:hypothetical protein
MTNKEVAERVKSELTRLPGTTTAGSQGSAALLLLKDPDAWTPGEAEHMTRTAAWLDATKPE